VFNEALFHYMSEELPFGGVGNSGMGFVHGKIGFEQVSHLKPVMDKLPINTFPFSARYPPYTQSRQNVMGVLMKYGSIPQRKIIMGLIILLILVFGVISYATGSYIPWVNQSSGFVDTLTTKIKKGIHVDL